MKAALVSSILATASAGGSLAITWSDCGTSSTHAKTTDVSPASLPLGAETAITGTGDLDKTVSGGTYDMELKAGGGIIDSHFTGNNCDQKDFDLPLGLGTLSWDGLSCPLAAASGVKIGFKTKLAASLPPALATSTIGLKAVDQDSEQVLCVDLKLAATSDFDAYMAKFGKAYNGDSEYASRKAIYEENMKHAAAENAKGTNTHTLGETTFSDLTLEEFQALNIRGFKSAKSQGLPNLGMHEETPVADDATIDWTTKGAVTPVKDQGQCGSCWSFSTTGGLEGAWQLSTGNLVSMSEQQFVDCDTGSMGCNGGSMEQAFGWSEKTSVATESSYPYTARDGSCKSSYTTAIPSGGVTGYKNVGTSASALKSAIQSAPISVAIEADQSVFQSYTGGVISSGCGSNLDHGVLAVGINSDGSIKVKNSWGTSWGVNGFVNIATSQCGITSDASYPVVDGSAPPGPAPGPSPGPAPTPSTGHHYEAPPCQDDEIAGQLEGGGSLCAPKCNDDGSCSTDYPEDVQNPQAQCVLQDQSGGQYCALTCGLLGGDCPAAATCSSTLTGVCVYPDASVQTVGMSLQSGVTV